MSSAEAKASIFAVSSATAATIVAIGLVSAIAFDALPFHAALAAGTMIGVGGVTALMFKATGAAPMPGARDLRSLVLAAIAGVGLSLFGTGFLALEVAFVPALAEAADAHSEMMWAIVRPDAPHLIPVVLLVVGVLPAVFEEVLFRGVMRSYLSRTMTRAGRIAVLGLLFGLMHVSVLVLLPLVYAGVLWTFLAERTDGWLAPACSHFAMNATSAVVLVRIGAMEEPGLALALSLVVGGSALATLAISRVVDRGA